MQSNDDASMAALERSTQMLERQTYLLRLYVTGQTPRSVVAIERIKMFCEKYLEGRYDLEVIDIYQQNELDDDDQIVAAPTLIKKFPLPLRRLVGDMSNEGKILMELDIQNQKGA